MMLVFGLHMSTLQQRDGRQAQKKQLKQEQEKETPTKVIKFKVQKKLPTKFYPDIEVR